jgi:hypothetical protein
MNNDLRLQYQDQTNLGVGAAIMAGVAVVIFPFALLWVSSLATPEPTATFYHIRSATTTYPFAKKIHIQGGGKSGNKIGVSGTVEAQSGAGEDSPVNVSGRVG